MPPTFTGSYTNVSLGCNPSASDITAALGTATATDGCSTPTVTSTDGTVTTTSCCALHKQEHSLQEMLVVIQLPLQEL